MRGIEFSLSAEGEGAEALLRRAVICFDRAGDFYLTVGRCVLIFIKGILLFIWLIYLCYIVEEK